MQILGVFSQKNFNIKLAISPIQKTVFICYNNVTTVTILSECGGNVSVNKNTWRKLYVQN